MYRDPNIARARVCTPRLHVLGVVIVFNLPKSIEV